MKKKKLKSKIEHVSPYAWNTKIYKSKIKQSQKKNIKSNKDILTNETSLVAVVNIISCLDKIAKCWIEITDLAKPTYLIKP